MIEAPSHDPGDPPDPFSELTPQERRILRLLGEGLSNREIADRTALAEQTVKNYVSRLLRKLGLERRAQAALLLVRSQSPSTTERGPRRPT